MTEEPIEYKVVEAAIDFMQAHNVKGFVLVDSGAIIRATPTHFWHHPSGKQIAALIEMLEGMGLIKVHPYQAHNKAAGVTEIYELTKRKPTEEFYRKYVKKEAIARQKEIAAAANARIAELRTNSTVQ